MGPQTVSDLDRFTDNELCQMHLDTYRRGLEHFEEADRLLGVMTGLPYPSAEYAEAKAQMSVAMAAGTEAHELLRHIGAVSRARRASTNA